MMWQLTLARFTLVNRCKFDVNLKTLLKVKSSITKQHYRYERNIMTRYQGYILFY